MARRNRQGGREFTREEATLVATMSEGGATQVAMAKALDCSLTTLKKYFGAQLKGLQPDGLHARFWSEAERNLVGLVVGIGHHNQSEIAAMVGISLGEFQAVFGEEIRLAKTQLDAQIGATIVQKALGGSEAMLRFYAERRMGWLAPEAAPAPPDRDAMLRKTIDDLDEEGERALRIVLEKVGAESPLTGPGPGEPIH
jgi:DNA-binding protein Fis